MPVTEYTACTDASKVMYCMEDLKEFFFEFASKRAEWLSENTGLDSGAKDMSVICLAEIGGAAAFIKSLTGEDYAFEL